MPLVNPGPFSIGTRVINGTSGSILFVDASGNVGQDNANLFWDDSANIFKPSTIQLDALTALMPLSLNASKQIVTVALALTNTAQFTAAASTWDPSIVPNVGVIANRVNLLNKYWRIGKIVLFTFVTSFDVSSGAPTIMTFNYPITAAGALAYCYSAHTANGGAATVAKGQGIDTLTGTVTRPEGAFAVGVFRVIRCAGFYEGA